MGKGDSRSRRGKIYQGSFGKTRPKDPARAKRKAGTAPAAAKPAAAAAPKAKAAAPKKK
jgi:ribosomal small subunit protein bTHX